MQLSVGPFNFTPVMKDGLEFYQQSESNPGRLVGKHECYVRAVFTIAVFSKFTFIDFATCNKQNACQHQANSFETAFLSCWKNTNL